mmetsp:Transcript_23687/g.34984  ORF Transcript_23687/g.34984 Transcript_23687/m.34984 type:complete len:219 (-) Transcript_23687:380-1036(-)
MKTVKYFALASAFMVASSAYNADHKTRFNIPASTSEDVEKNMIAMSKSRPTLSPGCLALRSADMTKNIDIREASPQKGLGAFATGTIQCGTYLGECSGECMTLNEVRARFWGKREPDVADRAWAKSRRQRNQGITGNYVMELRDGTFVCSEDSEQSTWTRFMNHAPSSDPECNVKGFWQTEIGGDYHHYPRFFAIRDIEEGEELHFDYGKLSGYESES